MEPLGVSHRGPYPVLVRAVRLRVRSTDSIRMKPSHRFNPPAEIAARAAYLAKGILGYAGVIMLFAAAVEHDVAGLLRGALCLAVSMLLHALLLRSGRLEACRDSLDAIGASEPPLPEGEDSSGFASLLEQRNCIEAKRGTPDFDPWSLSAVRHQIRAYLDAHPDFALRFRAYEQEDGR